jgi:hypothetical protein
MRFLTHIPTILVTALMLTACANKAPPILPTALTPEPVTRIDPEDYVLKLAMKNFLENSEAPISSQYDFSRTDLNNDGRRDALVILKSPYGYWCGKHGCTMLIMRATNNNFVLVNAAQPIREPLYISQNKTNGWSDIVTRISGRWNKAKNVTMRFDGRQYPTNPSNLGANNAPLLNNTSAIFDK